MTEHEWIALVGLCIAVLASLFSTVTIIFKVGKWAGQLETLAADVREAMDEWREDREKVQTRLYRHETKIALVEREIKRYNMAMNGSASDASDSTEDEKEEEEK